MSFWNAIVQSNTFNFAVLLLIFGVIYKKLDIPSVVEKIKQSIVDSIETAKVEKEKARQKLELANDAVQNLEKEINTRMDDASKRADDMSAQILQNANSKILLIEKNIEKTIHAEEKMLSADMMSKVMDRAVDLAREKVISALNDNPELHNKYIEESIGEL